MKTVYTLVALVAVSILFVSCGKSGLNNTYADYVGTEKDKIRESISKDESFALLDTLDVLIARIMLRNEQDKYKDTSLEDILDEHREKEALLEPRRRYLNLAEAGLKSILKNPESLIMPTLELENTDELIISPYGDDSTSRSLRIVFKARGGLNNLVEGVYLSVVYRDSTTGEFKEFGNLAK